MGDGGSRIKKQIAGRRPPTQGGPGWFGWDRFRLRPIELDARAHRLGKLRAGLLRAQSCLSTAPNALSTARSYTIFNPPARKNGTPMAAVCTARPAKIGAIAAAAGRTALVNPATRARSSAGTARNVNA